MNAIKWTVFGTGLGWRTRGIEEPLLTIIRGITGRDGFYFKWKGYRKAKSRRATEGRHGVLLVELVNFSTSGACLIGDADI